MSACQKPLFTAGDAGYHSFRIPSLCVAPDGSVLALCEGRRNGLADDGDIDLVMRRSTDGGQSWSDITVVGAETGEITIGNPCPITDRQNGRIVLLYTRNNRRAFVVMSHDNGCSFTPAQEITASITPSGCAWNRLGTGPGGGIVLAAGRLVAPVWYMEGDFADPDSRSYECGVIYSDDHGTSWQAGKVVPKVGPHGDESEVAETRDGRLCINMRCAGADNQRLIAWSDDGGESWGEPYPDTTLIDPACDGSLIRLQATGPAGEPVWVFSNAASTRRENLTVRAGLDEGATWPHARVLHPGPAAYSCLAETNDGTLLCLYERGDTHPYEELCLAVFDLQWLLDA